MNQYSSDPNYVQFLKLLADILTAPADGEPAGLRGRGMAT
jgi:hypothetical protein